MYANLTDTELLARLQATSALSPLEMELASRLERALDALDDATEALAECSEHLPAA